MVVILELSVSSRLQSPVFTGKDNVLPVMLVQSCQLPTAETLITLIKRQVNTSQAVLAGSVNMLKTTTCPGYTRKTFASVIMPVRDVDFYDFIYQQKPLRKCSYTCKKSFNQHSIFCSTNWKKSYWQKPSFAGTV